MSRVGSTHESGARLTSYKTEIYQPWKDQPVTTVSDVHVASPHNVEVPQPKVMLVDEGRPYRLVCKLVAEFLGTMIFVYIGSMSGYKALPQIGVINAAFAHGFTIFVLVTSLGHVSGGHFNPAVSWAVGVAGRMPIYEVPLYWIVQLFGGFIGSLLVRASLLKNQFLGIGAGATLLSDDDAWHQGLIVEIILTLILTQTVLNAAVETNNTLAPLAIGFTVALDIFGAGSISGASMNPARSLGPSLVGTFFFDKGVTHVLWDYHYIYWLGPLIGATISALNFRLFFAKSTRLVS